MQVIYNTDVEFGKILKGKYLKINTGAMTATADIYESLRHCLHLYYGSRIPPFKVGESQHDRG